MPTLLLVEDEAVLARHLVTILGHEGYDVRHAPSVEAAHGIVAATPIDIALVDLRLPDGSGLEVLTALVAADPILPVIMMTAYGSVADAVEAIKRGACDYVQKPFEPDEIAVKLDNAMRGARQRREISYYRERGATPGAILGESPAAQRLRQLVERVARSTGGPGAAAPTVLLLGETGSGKGHVARALYAAGGRRDGPFIEVNCTALPETLVEAELFGYEKGAFTDAKTARAGLLETAEGGTLFLDEVGHISAALQSKFLKVIEEKTVRRVGATATRRVDVQIVAATNRDLEAAVSLGEFREDLYQRLCVAVIRIPPLREREADAVRMARTFLAEGCKRYALPERRLSDDAESAIAHHAWPGNVRELANTMERVALFSDNEVVTAEDLGLSTSPLTVGRLAPRPSGEVEIDFPKQGLSLEAVEKALVMRAMQEAAGNQSAAARLLGISRDMLRYRLEKYALDPGLGDR